jgi:hypothetical protein
MTNVMSLAGPRAAPIPPATGIPDPIQLHASVHNALTVALHYMRQPTANVPGASRKVVQALAALRQLQAQGGAA